MRIGLTDAAVGPTESRPVGWAVCLALALLGAPLAARADEARSKANTTRAAREEAVRAIPFNKLSREGRTKATGVIQNLSLYRRLPVQSIDCDPDLYAFLIRHPEVVVNIWRLMGITKMELEHVDGLRYRVADGEGTQGQMEYLHTSADTQVIYSEGAYDGPLYPRTVRGKCLVLLRTNYRREPNGRYTVVGQLDTFLSVENLGVEVLAKTFQPLIGKAADHNFTETANFVANLSKTAETNEDGLLRLCRKITRIDAKTRDRFLELISAIPGKRAAEEIEKLSDTELVRTPQQATRE